MGKTGTGKSTLLGTMLREALRNGEGFALLDPHGDLVDQIIAAVPESGRDDVLALDVADDAHPFHWNPLERVPETKRSMAASGILEAMKKLWLDSWGPRVEHILQNALLALFELPEATLGDILRLVGDTDFRKQAAEQLANEQVRSFWQHEYPQYTYGFRLQAIAPLQNKIGAFLADPRLNRILSAEHSTFDLRRVMDEGQVLLVDLSKGKIGEDASALLGALLVSQIGVVGLSRADVPEEARADFYVYLDEFQSLATLSFASMLSELRKYRVGFVLANQYLGQLEHAVRDAVLGNVGTTICFRIGVQDAGKMIEEFSPEFERLDLAYLPNHQYTVKLMVHGATITPFSGRPAPPGGASREILPPEWREAHKAREPPARLDSATARPHVLCEMDLRARIDTIIRGDALAVLKTFPDECIDCCVTSPPYWALRDYGVAGQLGLEPTFTEYITKLCDLFGEVQRVLKRDGTCWVNMGDVYVGGHAGGSIHTGLTDRYDGAVIPQQTRRGRPASRVAGLRQKCLVQVPSRFALEMTNGGWVLRNEIVWQKPNAMPSSTRDRFTIDFEKLFFFVKSPRYHFRQQFEPFRSNAHDRARMAHGRREFGGKWARESGGAIKTQRAFVAGGTSGRNMRAVWSIPTHPYRGAHFATYPPELIRTPILAGCPPGGVVLDPFMGSGTTALVANGLSRHFVGIELNPAYIALARARLRKERARVA